MGWCRLCAAPCTSLQAETTARERAGAPGAPRGQATIDGAVLQGTVPPTMFTATAGTTAGRDVTLVGFRGGATIYVLTDSNDSNQVLHSWTSVSPD